ncbi:MAG TPA: YbhB/YbcL family Raf kinase inhibitor-like protein [Desulfuromonadaceae bacterium]
MGRWTALLLLVTQAGLFPVTAAGKEAARMTTITLTSPAFSGGGAIPAAYTCDGGDASPPLVIGPVPAGTRSLALVMDDPDAPVGTWVHWVLWNIPPEAREIRENGVPSGASQGRNSWYRVGYGGPCPPSGTHRYFFRLYALDTLLNLGAATTKAELERAMEGHLLGRGELMGTYRRH